MKKVAVVTGAGTGIGREIALELARNGYMVYANGRSAENSRKLWKRAKTLISGL